MFLYSPNPIIFELVLLWWQWWLLDNDCCITLCEKGWKRVMLSNGDQFCTKRVESAATFSLITDFMTHEIHRSKFVPLPNLSQTINVKPSTVKSQLFGFPAQLTSLLLSLVLQNIFWNQLCSVLATAVSLLQASFSLNTGCFFNWYPPKSSKYKKVNLG